MDHPRSRLHSIVNTTRSWLMPRARITRLMQMQSASRTTQIPLQPSSHRAKRGLEKCQTLSVAKFPKIGGIFQWLHVCTMNAQATQPRNQKHYCSALSSPHPTKVTWLLISSAAQGQQLWLPPKMDANSSPAM